MKCQAKTTKGTRCKHDAWEDWPMCRQHLSLACADLVAAKFGHNARHWVIIDNTEDDDWLEVE